MKFNDKLVVKKFYDLSVSELFQILKLRQNVFIVEQNCIYKTILILILTVYHFYLFKLFVRFKHYNNLKTSNFFFY